MPSTPKGSQLVAVTLTADEIQFLYAEAQGEIGHYQPLLSDLERKLYQALPADA